MRYRVNERTIASLRRTAHLVLPRWKLVVFVDGCFWHSCPAHGSLPVARREWWATKLERTVERDRETTEPPPNPVRFTSERRPRRLNDPPPPTAASGRPSTAPVPIARVLATPLRPGGTVNSRIMTRPTDPQSGWPPTAILGP